MVRYSTVNVRQRRIGGCKCGSSTCSSPVFCTVLSSNEFFGSDGERRKKNEMIEKGPSSADQGVRSWTNDQDTKIGGIYCVEEGEQRGKERN